MAAGFMVNVMQGPDGSSQAHVGLIMTDNIEFASTVKELLEKHPGEYRAKITRLPTHAEVAV